MKSQRHRVASLTRRSVAYGLCVFHRLWKFPLPRDALIPVKNGECDGFYQVLSEPTTGTRANTEAMRFCTGISSGWGLTANGRYTPLGGDFKDFETQIS